MNERACLLRIIPSFTSVGEAGVEPAYPSLIRRVPSPFGHSPVGKPGVEPGDYSLIRGAPSPVGYLPKAEGGGADSRGLEGRHWCSKPVAAPTAHLPERRAAGTVRSGFPPARFRDGACHPAGSLSTPAPQSPGDANTRAREWRRTERTMPSAFWRPCGFRPQPTPRPVHPPERKAEHSKPTELSAHRLAGEPGTPVRFTFRAPGGTRTRTPLGTSSWD
jgi:hypothetical protein